MSSNPRTSIEIGDSSTVKRLMTDTKPRALTEVVDPAVVKRTLSTRSSHSARTTVNNGLYRSPTLRVRASRRLIEGPTSAPFRRGTLSRLLRSFRPNTEIKVEQSEHGVSAAVLYAAEDGEDLMVPTSIVSGVPKADDEDLVCRNSAFEVRVVGMHVPNFDSWEPSADNELFMYSHNTADDLSEPIVHYDCEEDEYIGSSNANVYVPVPASKSYVTGSLEKGRNTNSRKSVNVRFCVLELDKPGQMTKEAIRSLGDVGRFMRQVPTISTAAPALKCASALSKKALHSYAKPDKVFMVDMDFALADRAKIKKKARAGEFLKYGYYFFLSQPIEGQLYASVRTPKNVCLMFKRCDSDNQSPRRWPFSRKPIEAKEFFPLADVSYIVVRVSEPLGGKRFSDPKYNDGVQSILKTPSLSALFREYAPVPGSPNVATTTPEAVRS